MSSLVSNSLSLPDDVGFTTFLWHLFTKNKYTDAHFTLEYKGSNASFSAHKFVLAIRSPYFADEFYGEENKIENRILLTDVNPEAFEAMLNYLYDHMPSIKTPNMACEVYNVAKQFQVTNLMTLCHEKLKQIKILPSNVFDILEASDYLHEESKRNECLNFIQENTKEIMSHYKLSEISPSMISIILSVKEMSLDSVMDLFKWIFEWAESRACENSECDTSSKAEKIRESLEKFLPQLPFASLSSEQFAKLYKSYTDVFDEDEVISIFMNLAISGSHSLPDWYKKNCTIKIKSGSSE